MNAEQEGLPLGHSRKAAFRDAGRHSAHVRFLRRAIPLGSFGGIVVIVVLGMFDPISRSPKAISVAHSRLDGTHITMEAPKLSGYREDGRPYELRAATGVQNRRQPGIIELHKIDARFTLSDNSVAHLESSAGIFDNRRNLMTFPGRVQVTTNSGYKIVMRSGEVNVKAGTLASNGPVIVRMPRGMIAADRLSASDGGLNITFEGHVRSRFRPATGTGENGANSQENAP